MTAQHLDPRFIDQQRQRLEALRNEVRGNQADAADEELTLNREWQEPRDAADRAADMNQQDTDDAIERNAARQLTEIDRALEKIDAGSYGLSDLSGEPIDRQRLEAKPEAIYTIEEERREEGQRRG